MSWNEQQYFRPYQSDRTAFAAAADVVVDDIVVEDCVVYCFQLRYY